MKLFHIIFALSWAVKFSLLGFQGHCFFFFFFFWWYPVRTSSCIKRNSLLNIVFIFYFLNYPLFFIFTTFFYHSLALLHHLPFTNEIATICSFSTTCYYDTNTSSYNSIRYVIQSCFQLSLHPYTNLFYIVLLHSIPGKSDHYAKEFVSRKYFHLSSLRP